MNYYILAIAGFILIALLIFLIKRNIKDEKKFESEMNQNYPHAHDNTKDIDSDETLH